MIIQCEKCSTKYKLDDSRLSPGGVKVRCTKCQNVFMVPPPAPPVIEPEELKEEIRDEPLAERAAQVTPQRPLEAATAGAGLTAESQKNAADPFKEFDIGQGPFSDDTHSEAKEKPQAPADDSLSDKGFKFKINYPEENKETGAKDDDFDFGFDDLEDKPAGQKVEQAPAPAAQAADAPSNVIPFSAGYSRDGKPAPVEEKAPEPKNPEEATEAAPEEGTFEDVFASTYAKELEEGLKPGHPASADEEFLKIEDHEHDAIHEDSDEGKPKAPAAQKRLGLFLAAAVVILGGGFIYYSGIIERLAQALTPGAAETVAEKTVEIESIKGFYVENSAFSSLFIIEARLKNISDAPQTVKALSGVVYNEKGEKIGSRSVAPGRILGMEDLKLLSREEFLKPFKDPSGGTIPPKGTVPVMVPFPDGPQGIAEFGIDVVR